MTATASAGVKAREVRLAGVGMGYGAVRALDCVDLIVRSGEFCTLLGPSGSGKTTLLKLIAGFEEPTNGAVHLGGLPMTGVPVGKRNVGFVFQNYALFPHMTAAANVAFPLEMRGIGAAEVSRRVEAMLGLVGLAGLGDRLPRALSGGQQQRVALARALVFEPDLLLMDEPLGALDKNLRETIQRELRRLHRTLGVTVMYVTHDQEEALFLSDRLVVMEGGRIAQAGTAEEIYARPVSAFVARFLGDCNLLPGRVIGEAGHGTVRVAVDGGGLAVVRSPETAGEILVGCRTERCHLLDTAVGDAIPVVVADSAFTGPHRKVLVQHPVGEMSVLVDAYAPIPGIGSECGLVFDPAHGFTLPSSGR